MSNDVVIRALLVALACFATSAYLVHVGVSGYLLHALINFLDVMGLAAWGVSFGAEYGGEPQ